LYSRLAVNETWRILHLEDEPDYSDFVREILAQAGIASEIVTVSTKAEFEAACETGTFGLILADYSLPGYNGLTALAHARQACPDVPVILLSGTIGEAAAIEGFRAGASDYVLKQWPERLAPAVQRAVLEVRQRVRQRRTEQALTKLGWQLNSTTTQRDAARLIYDIAQELLGCDAFSLSLFDAHGRLLNELLAVDIVEGRRVEIPPGQQHPVASPMARRVMESGAELILCAPDDPPIADAYMFGDRSRPSASLLVVPVRSGGTILGVLSVQSYRHYAYDTAQLATLQILADHCGGALERIRAQQESRELEERFYDVFNRSPDAIFVESASGRVLDVNRAGCELHGLTREELIGRHVRELVPPAQQASLEASFQQLFCGEASRLEGESLAANGKVVPVEIRTGRICYAGQDALLLHVRDISERKSVESALRSSEQLFHSVWENAADGMRLCDPFGRVVAANEAYCRLLGKTRAEVEGQPYPELFGESGTALDNLGEFVTQFAQRRFTPKWEGTVTLPGDRRAVVEQSNSFVELQGKPAMLLSVFREVTQQRRLEEQFRQAQKMEAIGQLAGGVAHDFNNLLTVIHGHASMLGMNGALDEMAGRSARQIVQAAERAAGLTRQLLTFSRRSVMQTRQLDFNEVVRNITKLLARILGEDITLQVEYPAVAPQVNADESMIEQVVMNLAVNARDAMPGGGELRLTVGTASLSDTAGMQHPDARPGEFVTLCVADAGTGIAAEHLPHIFEPFFTTKAKGKGTGLGLATVYGVLKQHQGWIEVESAPRQGTKFTAYFPRTQVGPPEPTPEARPVPRGGSETILLVEDEEPVREMVRCFLEARGYHVLEAESGVRALEVWAGEAPKVDLLLTDLVMPGGLNGRELAGVLRAERPQLRVVYMSGYSAEVLGREFVVQPGVDFLQKPFDPDRLAGMVRESLDLAAN
jgi:PAS domain S-box-containing protein